MPLFDRIIEMNNEKSAVFTYTPAPPREWRLSIQKDDDLPRLGPAKPEPVHLYTWAWKFAALTIAAPDVAGIVPGGRAVLFATHRQITAFFNGKAIEVPRFTGVLQLEYNPVQPAEVHGLHKLQAAYTR